MADRRTHILTGAGVGFALTAPLLALMYLASRVANLPMVAFDLFESIVRIPQLGGVVTKAIDLMVGIFSRLPGVSTDSASKGFEQFSALAQFMVIGLVAGVIYALLEPQLKRQAGMVIGVITLGIALLVESSKIDTLGIVWLGVLFIGWGYVLAWCIDKFMSLPAATVAQPDTVNNSRRQFLYQFGGSAIAVTLAAWGLGGLLNRKVDTSAGQAIAAVPTNTAATEAANATEQSGVFTIVPGTRPEITPNDNFYRVDVNVASAPAVDEKKWNLSVEGLVKQQLLLSYDDILKMAPVEQTATLQCISNPVGGNLISTTRWTAVRLRDVLNMAGLKDGVVEIKFTCSDGYTESLPLESAMDERTLLTYAMNGKALADIHGFPMRLFVPNRYGMKNPKWIIKIEAISEPHDGYWVVRGWDKNAFLKTVSVIDTFDRDHISDGAVPAGGIAFSGPRGISKVELSVDNGPWQPAQLKSPLSPLTWILWRANVKAAKGHHNVRVRAYEGDGTPQIEAEAPLHPSGASGYNDMDLDV
ncbi:MAG: molybdopterin-dependent oxidoreductase [Chloroflexota bacterium]